MAHGTTGRAPMPVQPDPGDTEALGEAFDRPTIRSSPFWYRLAVVLGVIIIGIWIVAIWLIEPVAAQMPGPACDKTEAIDAQLAARFREFPVAFGVAKSGALIKIYATENNSTWTIVRAMGNGVSCILEAGVSWETKRAGEQS